MLEALLQKNKMYANLSDVAFLILFEMVFLANWAKIYSSPNSW